MRPLTWTWAEWLLTLIAIASLSGAAAMGIIMLIDAGRLHFGV